MKHLIYILLFCILFQFQIYSFGSRGDKYDPENEETENFVHIYRQYLSTKGEGPNCHRRRDHFTGISEQEMERACSRADLQIQEFIDNDKNYLTKDPRGLNFSKYVYDAGLSAIHNEFVTKNIVIDQCLSELETVIELAKVNPPKCVSSKFCDVDSDVSPIVECDPNYKYSRIDGKCNNLENTNWGSSYHCQHRLLPPDYKDGVSEPRVAYDGTALPNARLITTEYMSDAEEVDLFRTSMHMIWGQFITHDCFKTLQYFSFAINCCPNPSVHRECFIINDIPRDNYTITFNQTCIGFVRSISCHTCSLGPRDQINAATQVLDLSHIYGGNQNNSNSLRTFSKGYLRMGQALDGSYILPKVNLNTERDQIDLTQCNSPSDRPWLTCFQNGDGIRGNQNPMSSALNVIFVERHNQHCKGLAKVNPHWNDEKTYQEARRLLIAEYNCINFKEFLPTIFNKNQMNYYRLNVKSDGFSIYNPNVNPSVFQCVGVAALRYGHSQVNSNFMVPKERFYDSTTFRLRDKFFEPSDIWDGNAQSILEGMCQMPTNQEDRHIDDDVQQFLFFNKCNPRILDLPAVNIQRGRDHGVPAYCYYLEYCTGTQIRCWNDLIEYIPIELINKLRKIYKDYRDIDLFVGGLSETHLNGSLFGPTFGCLLGIQFHHWKYGDRFYFEHLGQSGSFTKDQLNNIRDISWMSNLLCKTTKIKSIQRNAFWMPSKNNKIIDCNGLKDINYSLWKERGPPHSAHNQQCDCHQSSYQ